MVLKMIRELEISGRILKYDLTRKKVKNLNLRVHRDGSVAVSANSRISIEYIDDFLRSMLRRKSSIYSMEIRLFAETATLPSR